MASGRPAIAATPTAIMAPEISPPGRFAHRNSAPPAVPIASVSSTLRVLARLGMANAIDAGIRFTLPYGKSPHRGQMHHAHAAMHAFLPLSTAGEGKDRCALPSADQQPPGRPLHASGGPLSPP